MSAYRREHYTFDSRVDNRSARRQRIRRRARRRGNDNSVSIVFVDSVLVAGNVKTDHLDHFRTRDYYVVNTGVLFYQPTAFAVINADVEKHTLIDLIIAVYEVFEQFGLVTLKSRHKREIARIYAQYGLRVIQRSLGGVDY